MRFTWPIPNDPLHTGSSVAVVSGNRTLPFRVFAALLAGMIAVAANIALLSIASTAGIRTAQGGHSSVHKDHSPCRSLCFFADGWVLRRLSQAVSYRPGLVMAFPMPWYLNRSCLAALSSRASRMARPSGS